MAARIASPCVANRDLANDTTSMLLAVATPMHMMAPIRAGTLSVVCVKKRKMTIPAKIGRAHV